MPHLFVSMFDNNADLQNEILLSVMICACLHCYYLYGPRYTVISFHYSMENNQLAKYAKLFHMQNHVRREKQEISLC